MEIFHPLVQSADVSHSQWQARQSEEAEAPIRFPQWGQELNRWAIIHCLPDAWAWSWIRNVQWFRLDWHSDTGCGCPKSLNLLLNTCPHHRQMLLIWTSLLNSRNFFFLEEHFHVHMFKYSFSSFFFWFQEISDPKSFKGHFNLGFTLGHYMSAVLL